MPSYIGWADLGLTRRLDLFSGTKMPPGVFLRTDGHHWEVASHLTPI